MSRKHTKRKHWATGHLLLGSQRDKMVLPAHMALDAIEMGAGDISHRHTLAAFLNVCATLAGRMPGTAQETRDALAAAADALVNTDRRFLRLKKWGLSAEDMRALRIENMFEAWEEENDSKWDDFGVKITGHPDIHWVSHTLARQEFDLDVVRDNDEVVNTISLLDALLGNRAQILAVVSS
jgi:hypothetical protein